MCLTSHAQYSTPVCIRQSYFLTLARKRKLLRNIHSFFLCPGSIHRLLSFCTLGLFRLFHSRFLRLSRSRNINMISCLRRSYIILCRIISVCLESAIRLHEFICLIRPELCTRYSTVCRTKANTITMRCTVHDI